MVQDVPDVTYLNNPPHFPATIDSLSDEVLRAIVHSQEARIGLQVEGTQHLPTSPRNEYASMRHFSLLLAGKLSQASNWNITAQHETKDNEHHLLPISIYWNTVKQALVASQELLFLKRIEKHKQHRSVYDRIQIRCLVGEHPMIPADMLLQYGQEPRPQQQRKKQKEKTKLSSKRGLIMVVQPTEYNDEYQPPGPAIAVWTALQKLVASAAIEDLPVVVLSPRFLPQNPAPWVLRDFDPPALSWTVHDNVAVWQTQQQSSNGWHVFAVDNDDDHTSYPYLATCRENPTPKRLRHLVQEHVVP